MYLYDGWFITFVRLTAWQMIQQQHPCCSLLSAILETQ